MKKIIILIIAIYLLSGRFTASQNNEVDIYYDYFLRSYNSGDILNAERYLLLILGNEDSLSRDYKVSVFNNLGATYFLLGKYDKSLDYYNKAELIIDPEDAPRAQGDLYINKAIIFGIRKMYSNAFEYFDKAIRIYGTLANNDLSVISSLSLAYMNYGRILTETGDYRYALELFNKSADLAEKYKLPSLATVYMNIARANVDLNDSREAEIFYSKCIKILKEQFSDQHFRLAEAYSGYAQLLESELKFPEAFELLNLALSISRHNYGEKSSQVSLIYKNLGDHFADQSEPKQALQYYQKALISIVTGFDNTDILTNPPVDSSLFTIRLLENLKGKALAMEQLSQAEQNMALKIKYSKAAGQTIELALKVIEEIKNGPVSNEDRTYLAENEKETYVNAIKIINNELELTGETSLVRKMYGILQNAKSSVLREEIIENGLLYSAIVPDSLHEKKNDLELTISTYNNFIQNEIQSQRPDSIKINFWKDEIFVLNRKLEKLSLEISSTYPEYTDLLRKTTSLTVGQIMRGLRKNETIIDFLLSGNYKNGVRACFIFCITRDTILLYETDLDSHFASNAEIIRAGGNPVNKKNNHQQYLMEYVRALNYMYTRLIEPIQKYLHSDHLIIIPDDEIAWLPFDALIESLPSDGITSYEGLPFLINRYIISYGPSSSLIFNKSSGSRKVFAFSPDYSVFNNEVKSPLQLSGASKEIDEIFKLFRGSRYSGDSATETNFRSALENPGIFHLAMHSISDTLNSNNSYLLFDNRYDSVNDGILYNYEISLMKVESPMIVLSSCNSGSGELFRSEGLLSLARGFFLSGASSVIMTSWEINDEVSAQIMGKFYQYLARGKQKDEALHLAKLDFLMNNPPSLMNPYYWAAYKIMGNNNSVTVNRTVILFSVSAAVVIITGLLVYYFRRRRIF